MPSASRVYPPHRLRRMLILLTILTLPVVFGASAFIYYWVQSSVMIDEKLKQERWMNPSRVFARPTELAPGRAMTVDRIVRTLTTLTFTAF